MNIKKIISVFLVVGPMILLSTISRADQRTEEAVVNKTYSLSTINDVNVENQFQEIPYIHFSRANDGSMRVDGRACNDFSGSISVQDNKSFTKDMISSKKVCSDALLKNLDFSISRWFNNSMIQEDNGILTIYTDGTVVKMKEVR